MQSQPGLPEQPDPNAPAGHINRILVCDPSPEFLSSLLSSAEATRFPLLSADNFTRAQRFLSTNSEHFSAIFLNPALAEADTLTLIGLAHLNHPAVPVFLIFDSEIPSALREMSEDELMKSGLQPMLLRKPVSYGALLQLVNPMAIPEELRAATPPSIPNSPDSNNEEQADDRKFFSVRADRFLTGAKSVFDVYVRLGSGRYVKILRAGDVFSPERIFAYIKKGVSYFFLNKESQQRYVELGDRLVKSMIYREAIPVDVKVAKTMHAGEEALKLLQSVGINSDNLKYASNFITNVTAVLKQLSLGRREHLQSFIKQLSHQGHATGTSMIAALIAKQLNYEYRDSVNTIGLASLFHDIGLDDEIACGLDEDGTRLSSFQKKLFMVHPTAGAMMLKDIRSIAPVVPQAIEQHHERRDKSGFPQSLGGSAIHQIAEIVGLADEFFGYVKLAQGKKEMDPLAAIQCRNLYDLFSPAVVNAFKAAFEPKSPAELAREEAIRKRKKAA